MKEHPAPRTLLDLHLAGELLPTGVGSIGSMELSTPERDRLITLQHAVIAGARAMEERNQMLLRLFDEGVTQSALAAALSDACEDAGAEPVSVGAVFASIKRQRAKRDT